MKVWLYKARDGAVSGEPRPDADQTRAFATKDGILCRSAFNKGGDWVANVQSVEAGDIMLMFFRQVVQQPSVLFFGAFRVRDPGDARLNEDCDLAIVHDPDLRERLAKAYGVRQEETVTGWLLEPASHVVAPPLDAPEIADFLGRRATLTEYHGSLNVRAVRAPYPPSSGLDTPTSGRVKSVSLDGVTVFSSVMLELSPSLNVIIGENGTGKTHLLKCMYALLRAAQDAELPVFASDPRDKLERVLGGPARGLRAGEGAGTRVRVTCAQGTFEREEMPGERASWTPPQTKPHAIFLPSREVLSMFPGFIKLYESRDLAFDETYYDLCKELSQVELRELPASLSAERDELQAIVGGPARLDMKSFVVDTAEGPISAPMIAEGHRKLACVEYLIKNGALTPETTLFWDEPEANLNPKLVRVAAQIIRKLAAAGVQVCIATHDYLLARELSMAAEYAGTDTTRFFVLHRPSPGGAVEVESGARWGDLQQNPIFEAFAAHYDHEQDLFAGAARSTAA